MTARRVTPRRPARFWAACLIAPILVLAGCSSDDEEDGGDPDDSAGAPSGGDSSDEGEDADESVVNVHLYNDPRSFNPTNSYHGPDQLVMGLIFQKLFVATPEGIFEPRLAESWEISDDAQTFTFHLHDGLTWNDGTPLTSSDVKFSFELIANPDATPNAPQWDDVVGWQEFADGQADDVSGFQTPDDQTFVVELNEPNAGYLANLSTQSRFVIPEHILGDVPVEDIADHPYFLEPTVGYGPYNFVRFEVDQFVELEANPDFHLGEPEIQQMFLYPLESDVAAAQLGTGEMDVARISATDVETVDGFDNATVRPAEPTGYLRMSFETIHEENSRGAQPQERFQDPRVRQAMVYAIDRQGILDTVLGGFGEVVNTTFHAEWAVPDDLNDYSYDPERARELLDEAGWDSSEPVEIAWRAGNRDRDSIMTIVQEQWNEVGIQTELVPLDAGVEHEGNDMGFYGGGFSTVEPSTERPSHMCGFGQNNSGYCNPELDALWAQADQETDPDVRAELYQDIARIVNEEVPYIWVVADSQLWATSDRLEGFVPNGDFVNQFQDAFKWRIAD